MARKTRSASANTEQESKQKKSARQATDTTTSGNGKQKAKGTAAPTSRGKPKKGKKDDEAYRPPPSVGASIRKSARLASTTLPATPDLPSTTSKDRPHSHADPQLSPPQNTPLAGVDELATAAESGGSDDKARICAGRKPESRTITQSDYLPDRKAGLRAGTLTGSQSRSCPGSSANKAVKVGTPGVSRVTERRLDATSTDEDTSSSDSAIGESRVTRGSAQSASQAQKGEKAGMHQGSRREATHEGSSTHISALPSRKKRKMEQAEGNSSAKKQRSKIRPGETGEATEKGNAPAPAATEGAGPDSPKRRSDNPPLFRPLSESSRASSAPTSHAGLAPSTALTPDSRVSKQAELDKALILAMPAPSDPDPAPLVQAVTAQQVYPRPLSNITEIDELLTDEESAQLSMAALYPERQHAGAAAGAATGAGMSETAATEREYVLEPTYDLQEDPTFLAMPDVVIASSHTQANRLPSGTTAVKDASPQARQGTPSVPPINNPDSRAENTAMCAAEDLQNITGAPDGSLPRSDTVLSLPGTAPTAFVSPSAAGGTPLRRSSRASGSGGSVMKVGSYSETRPRKRKHAEEVAANTETSSSRTTLQSAGAKKKSKTSVSRPGAEGEHRPEFKLPVGGGTAAIARQMAKVPKHVKRKFRLSSFKPTSKDQLSAPLQSNLLAPGSWLKPTTSGDPENRETPAFFLACGNTPFDTSALRFSFDLDNDGNPNHRRVVQPREGQLEDDDADNTAAMGGQEGPAAHAPVAEGNEDPLHMLLRAAQMISLDQPIAADDTAETGSRTRRRGLLNPLPAFDKDCRVSDAYRLELLADVAAMRERLPRPARTPSAASGSSTAQDLSAVRNDASFAAFISPTVCDQDSMIENQAEEKGEEQIQQESAQQSERSMPQQASSNRQLSPDDELASPLHNGDTLDVAHARKDTDFSLNADEQTDQMMMLEHTTSLVKSSNYEDDGPICPSCLTEPGLPDGHEHGECYRNAMREAAIGESEQMSMEEPLPLPIKHSRSPALPRATPDLPGSRPRRARRPVLQASSPHKSPTSAHTGPYVPPSCGSSSSSGSKGRGSRRRSSSVVPRHRSRAPSPMPSSLDRNESHMIGLIRSFKADPGHVGKRLVRNARTSHRPRMAVTRSVVATASVRASSPPASVGVESKEKAGAAKEKKRSQKSLKSAASSLPGGIKSSMGITAASKSSGSRRTER